LAAPGVTDSQLPPGGVVEAPVANDTAADGSVVNVTCCDKGTVEPSGAVGVHDAGLAVTVGGGGPLATIVALVRLKVVGLPVPTT
jgi:hypothetical protein